MAQRQKLYVGIRDKRSLRRRTRRNLQRMTETLPSGDGAYKRLSTIHGLRGGSPEEAPAATLDWLV
ncbi:MAG: hypothetical protein K9L28_06900 [Synergistales bacterium]|nr:hypothetical protein [Synergistales bacterium]